MICFVLLGWVWVWVGIGGLCMWIGGCDTGKGEAGWDEREEGGARVYAHSVVN